MAACCASTHSPGRALERRVIEASSRAPEAALIGQEKGPQRMPRAFPRPFERRAAPHQGLLKAVVGGLEHRTRSGRLLRSEGLYHQSRSATTSRDRDAAFVPPPTSGHPLCSEVAGRGAEMGMGQLWVSVVSGRGGIAGQADARSPPQAVEEREPEGDGSTVTSAARILAPGSWRADVSGGAVT
jgi:hypothetical protein